MMFAGIYAIFVGLLMIGTLVAIMPGRQETGRGDTVVAARFHWAAELLTAISLVAGGFGLLTYAAWGEPVYVISMGMLLYTVIRSHGYYVTARKWFIVGALTVTLVPAVISLGFVL